MKIDTSKKYETKAGHEYRFYGDSGTDPCIFHGAIKHEDGAWQPITHHADGRHGRSRTSSFDLVEAESYNMKKAKKLYGEGVEFLSVGFGLKFISEGRHFYEDEDGDISVHGDGSCRHLVFMDGKWAEIVEPKSENLKYAEKHYPKGTRILFGTIIKTSLGEFAEGRSAVTVHVECDGERSWIFLLNGGKWREIIKDTPIEKVSVDKALSKKDIQKKLNDVIDKVNVLIEPVTGKCECSPPCKPDGMQSTVCKQYGFFTPLNIRDIKAKCRKVW